ASVIKAIQKVTKAFLISIFKNTNINAIYAKRVIINTKNINLAKNYYEKYKKSL
ncbi:hypothetical protein BDV95DRAFT_493285, partial [Massariosphaeria phaeospora]